jgi:hypothetical protein
VRGALVLLFALLAAPPAGAEETIIVVPDSEREVADLLRGAVDAGRKRVEGYFGRSFPKPFLMEVLSSRSEMDAVFAQRWKAPKTACWMVAAGVGDRLFVLSPRVWKTQACEHDARPAHVGEIVGHELVHVFHGQYAPNGDFNGMDELAWFVEGLATSVSGQLDGAHAGDARAALKAGRGPKSLARAWSGRYKYGVSGSLVRFVETTQGRATIDRLLRVGTNAAAMATLGTTEGAFLSAWRKEIEKPAKR